MTRDEMITSNIGFVVSIARQYECESLTQDDLISEGTIGLIKAADKFDETKGMPFPKYAVWFIRQSIEKAISQHGELVKRPNTQPPTAPPRVNRTIAEQLSSKGNEHHLLATPSSEELETSLNALDERQKKVICMYLGIDTEKLTMAEIAEEMGLTRERVRQIRDTATRKMRKTRTL